MKVWKFPFWWASLSKAYKDLDGKVHKSYVSSQKTFALMKTSWRSLRLRLQKTSLRRLGHTSSTRLQHAFKSFSRRLQDVFKTSCQDVFKAFSRRLQDVLQKHLQDIFKTSSRRLQDVFETFCKRLQDIFKKFSRRIIKLKCS